MGQRGLVCFLRFSKRKGVGDSDLYYFKDKGSIKITSKLEALGRTLHWLFYPEHSVEFWQNSHISQASQALMWCRKKIRWKKNYRSEFFQSSFIFVMCLLKEVYRKRYERNLFCGQKSIWGSYRDRLLMILPFLLTRLGIAIMKKEDNK